MNSFIGEIRAFPYTFVPYGWLECNGQSVSIHQYQALYSILGILYGGDGTTNFNLPNIQGQCLVGEGYVPGGYFGYRRGSRYGSETVVLSENNLPPHSHDFLGKGGVDVTRTSEPGHDNLSYLTNITYQRPSDPTPKMAMSYLDQPINSVVLAEKTITPNGSLVSGPTPHENRSPFLAIRYCICVMDGDYPVRPW